MFSDDTEFIRFTEFQGYTEALDFILHGLTHLDGWVVFCDEDCFVTNQKAIESIIEHMKQNDMQVAGIPDGGVISHRSNSWTNINPFFFIANTTAVREKMHGYTRDQIVEWALDFIPEKPRNIGDNFDHNHWEPFAGVLYFLYDNFRILFLDAQEHEDGISTKVIFKDKLVALHSWYGRAYVDEHKERIDNLYNEVLKLKV